MAKRKPITVERFVSIDGGETYKRWEEYTGEEKVKIATKMASNMAHKLKELAEHNPETMEKLYQTVNEP